MIIKRIGFESRLLRSRDIKLLVTFQRYNLLQTHLSFLYSSRKWESKCNHAFCIPFIGSKLKHLLRKMIFFTIQLPREWTRKLQWHNIIKKFRMSSFEWCINKLCTINTLWDIASQKRIVFYRAHTHVKYNRCDDVTSLWRHPHKSDVIAGLWKILAF